MAHVIQQGTLTADVANSIVEEIRRRPMEKQSPPQPTPEPSRQAPSEPVSDGAQSGRDARSGRFTAGNRFSRGNPFSRRQAALRTALVEAVGAEQLQAIARKLASLAASGDIQAAALLLAYVVGKPAATVNPDMVDLEEWRLFDAQLTVAEILRNLLDNVAVQSALEAVQMHLKETFRERVKPTSDGTAAIPTQDVMALRDKRSGRKRGPSRPLGG
jgi:hypothetical protein